MSFKPGSGVVIIGISIIIYAILLVLNASGIETWLPRCLLTHFTGLNCLGCGMNRAIILFLQGNFVAALEMNSLIIFTIPLAIIFVYYLPSFLFKKKYYG
ncbi:MAG TPA: DUF2752 domain-containing protein [Cyclobacteriaceae bacterium]